MKLSKEELSAKINDLDIDEEMKVSLMEDIADSIEDSVETEPQENGELEELKIKYESLREKYKERFLKGSDETEEKEDEKDEEDDELKEEEVIDVKEI
jgi:hypothetical protein